MAKKNLYLMLDCETFGTFKQATVYDLGMAVVDKRGRVYAKYSFVISDTFLDMADEAATAYYASKFPMYHEEIDCGKRRVVTFAMARKVANELVKRWQVRAVVAHNAKFDNDALDYTTRRLKQGTSFFYVAVEWFDLLQMVADTIAQQKMYAEFCRKHGYMTRHSTPRPQMKAEVIYRYISGNNDFIESHTGLEDVTIETAIMAHVFRQHKKMRTTFYNYTY